MFTGIIRRFSSDPSHHPEALQADEGAGCNDHHHTTTAAQDGVGGVFTPPHRVISPAPFRPPPLEPVVLRGYRDGTAGSARLLTNTVAEEIRIMIPERLRISEDWRLVYSLEQDGASLGTLFQKARQFEGRRVGFVVVVRDGEGGTFGAYLSEYPHPAMSYFGNGECFLWRASLLPSLPPPPSAESSNLSRATTLVPSAPTTPTTSQQQHHHHQHEAARPPSVCLSERIRFTAFPCSGMNEYFINCEARFLSVGAGDGHYGLWLDDALERGHSSQSQTFGNEPLSDQGDKFDILGVELWAVGVP